MTSVTDRPSSTNAFNGARPDTVPEPKAITSQYNMLDEHINAKKISTIRITTSNGSKMYVAFKRDFKSDADKRRFMAILKKIRYDSEEASMRCKTCIMGFIRNYAAMVFQDGKTLLGGLPTAGPDMKLLAEAEKCFSTFGKWVIIDGPIGTEFEGGYSHLYVPLPKCELNSFTNENYNWFINQHFNTLDRLMSENNNDGIIPSLELLLTLLPKVTYGDKIQKSAQWFLVYMHEYRKVNRLNRNIVVLEALLNQYMVPGIDEEPIIGMNLKQTKDTVLKAMSCAHSKDALVTMLTKLFDPTTYMRKTADPTKGQLEVAMSIFKDAGFFTTIMTVINLLTKYGGVAPPSSSSDDSSGDDAASIWGRKRDSLKANEKKGERGGAGGFAQRAGTTAFDPPTTIRGLYKRLSERDPTLAGLLIYVKYDSHPVMLTEFPTSANDLFKNKYLWAFKKDISPQGSYGISSGYQKITGMTAPGTMARNVAFTIEGARIRGKVGNSCFPSFLKEGVQRKAGHAFEDLNKTTSAKIPEGDAPLAIGIGTSRSDSLNGLISSVTFKTKDGHVFTISKWDV